jgi:hypothetical protein
MFDRSEKVTYHIVRFDRRDGRKGHARQSRKRHSRVHRRLILGQAIHSIVDGADEEANRYHHFLFRAVIQRFQQHGFRQEAEDSHNQKRYKRG